MGAGATASYIQDSADTDSALSISTTRVGIGTANPGANLDISKDGGSSAVDLFITNTGTDTNDDTAIKFLNTGSREFMIGLDRSSANFVFSQGAAFGTNDRLVIQAGSGAGNVGINESSPAHTLEVGGDIGVAGNYIVNEQGRQDHVANTMPAPYYRFDGVDDRITVGSHANLQPNLSDFTWACWFINEGITGSDNGLIEYGSGSDRTVIYLNGSSYIVHNINDGSNAITTTANKTAITDTNWHHVVCVVDRSSATGHKIYIDGVEETYSAQGDATTLTGSIEPTTFVIGDNYVGSGEHKGSINDVKLYNLALSAAEVKELYSGASVPYKYKGANQAAEASDFTGDADNYGAYSGSQTVTYNQTVDAVAGCLKMVQTHSTAGGGFEKAAANFDTPPSNTNLTGKAIRVTFDYFVESGSGLANWGGGHSGTARAVGLDGTYASANLAITENAWQTNQVLEYKSNHANFYVSSYTTSDGATTDNLINGKYFAIKNVRIDLIGAVAEYDGSTAGAHQWGDKSGNELHGTVGDGAGGSTAPTLENTPYDSGTEYEEGTWTGVVSDGSNNATMHGSATTGTYIKVGNIVTVSGYFLVTSLGSVSGAIRLTGLPFTVDNNNRNYAAFAVSSAEGLNVTAGYNISLTPWINTTYAKIWLWDSTAGGSDMTGAELSADGGFMISGSYMVG